MSNSIDHTEWFVNKIKGGIAEATCRAHFEALGYTVENFGIEHIAPQYAINSKKPNSDFFMLEFQQNLQRMPDFLISGTYPQTSCDKSGKTVALLVEAKYRENVNLVEFNKSMIERYQNLQTMGISFMIYLVSKYFRTNGNPMQKKSEQTKFVHIGLFEPNCPPMWLSAGEKSLNKFPLTLGRHENENFNTIYSSVIAPCLGSLFLNQTES